MAKNKFFTNKLVKIGKDEAIKRVNRAVSIVENTAKLLVPVDTANLRNSIDNDIETKRNIVTGSVFTNADYAVFVEFGTGQFAENGQGRKDGWVYRTEDGKFYFTKGMKPQPFLRPALRNNVQKIKAIFTK